MKTKKKAKKASLGDMTHIAMPPPVHDLENATFTFKGKSVPGSKLAELLGLTPNSFAESTKQRITSPVKEEYTDPVFIWPSPPVPKRKAKTSQKKK